VTLCRIDAIGFSDFIQTPVGRIEAGSFGCHTYNRYAGCETIDIFGQVGGLQEATVSYVPLGTDTRSLASVDKATLHAEFDIRLAARS
jgi:hypothetical protein